MTDEEMAVRYADNYNLMNKDLSPKSPRHIVIEVFLAGLKAGRPKWHKVADDDYPPCENDNHYSINVLTDSGDIAYYDYNDDYWAEEPASVEIDPPIAWCEIPKYTEAD
jgi:hypothetical protein